MHVSCCTFVLLQYFSAQGKEGPRCWGGVRLFVENPRGGGGAPAQEGPRGWEGVCGESGNLGRQERGQRKGATPKTVKNISTLFDIFSRRAKNFEMCQTYFSTLFDIFLRRVWVSIKFLSAKFGLPPPGGKEHQFYGQKAILWTSGRFWFLKC